MEGEARKTWGIYRLAIGYIHSGGDLGNYPLESGSLPELKLVVENNRYSYSTPSRCSPAAFQPADLSHLTLGGNSPFALSVPPRPLAAKLINLEARNYLLFKSTLGNL